MRGVKKKGCLRKPVVFRRLAIWRTVESLNYKQGGNRKRQCYLSLDGVFYGKLQGYGIAEKDTSYLEGFNVTRYGKNSGLNRCYRQLDPYGRNWSRDPCELSHWYLPESIINCYRLLGVTRLYSWQCECLQKSLGDQSPEAPSYKEGSTESQCPDRIGEMQSILYAAPTSGGKSLVADILMIRAALFHGKASLLVLPHISLCDERVSYLRSIVGEHSVGLKIRAFHHNDGVDIAVCTIEKANALINRLIIELMQETELRQPPYMASDSVDPAITQLGLVVLDELHLVGDTQRGFLLELLLTKLRRLSTLLKHGSLQCLYKERISIRVVGLSATLPNLSEMARWLEAEVYETCVRPLPLHLYYKIDNKLMQVMTDGSTVLARELHQCTPLRDGNDVSQIVDKDHDHLGFLVAECVAREEQCLVFCATKQWCQKACVFLTKILPQYLARQKTKEWTEECETLIDALTVIAPSRGAICPIILNGLYEKVSYHHAVVENAFRKRQLLVLCATSTLAIGVNLPVSRVIFRSTQIGKELLDAARFRQMAGRAGRKGFDVRGEAIALCSNTYDAARTARLLSSPVQPVRSALVGLRLCRLILELLVLRLAQTTQAIEDTVVQESFLAYQELMGDDNVASMNTRKDLIQKSLKLALDFLYATATFNYSECKSLNSIPGIQPLDVFTVLIPFFNTSDDEASKLACHYPDAYSMFNRLRSSTAVGSALPLTPATMDPGKNQWANREVSELFHKDYGNGPSDVRVEVTPLGAAIVQSATPVPEGTLIFAELYRVRTQGLFLKSELHLLYLIATTERSSENSLPLIHLSSFVRQLDYRSSALAQFYGITEASSRQVSRMTGFKSNMMDTLCERWMTRSLTLQGMMDCYRMISHKKFHYALLLYDVFHEAPLDGICKRFDVRLGEIMALKQGAVLQAGKLSAFCEWLQWNDFAALFRGLGDKLHLAYRAPECVELRAIDVLQDRQAKALLDAGIRSIRDVAGASMMHLCRALETLGRTEIPSGSENREFLERQARRRAFLAGKIRERARNLLTLP